MVDKKMGKKEEEWRNIASKAGAFAGDVMSQNVQAGSDMAVESMEELLFKAGKISKVGFEQSKGNLFEYIESAKLQTNMANKGYSFDKNPVTDIPESRGGYGGHTAPDDFRMQKNNKVIGRGQAKYNNDPQRAARNFVNPKYRDMQRVAPIDQMDDIKKYLDEMLENGEISKGEYQNAVENLQYKGLTDPDSSISSGGTTTTEIQKLQGKDGKLSPKAVKEYIMKFKDKQFLHEIGVTSMNMAMMSGLTTGVVSAVKNMFNVFQNGEELDEALKEIGADVARGTVRGAGTGSLSSIIRISGVKADIPILSDSTVATVMAGGVIDGGVAIYAYAQGEISSEELRSAIIDTTVKSTATVYFMKSITAAVGTVNPFIPMAIYTAAGYIVSCTKAIISEAKLNAAEYDRMTVLLQESTKLVKEYHKKLNTYMKQYEQNQRQILQGFLNTFEYSFGRDTQYEQAIYCIVSFANQMGIILQHKNFGEFKSAMLSNEDFILQ